MSHHVTDLLAAIFGWVGATEGATAIVLAGMHAGSNHQRGAIMVLLLIILVIWCFS